MSYFSIDNNINNKLDIIDELNKTDIIQEINDRDILNEFSNKKQNNIFVGTIQNYYAFLGYTVLSLLTIGFKKVNYRNVGYNISQLINGNFNRANFIQADYSIQDIINDGFKFILRILGYSVLELYNIGFQKIDFDLVGYSVYDIFDVLTPIQRTGLVSLGYSQSIINAYRSFIFQIATTSWNSINNHPYRYPINNNFYSFQDLSINHIDINGTTTITIQWNKYNSYYNDSNYSHDGDDGNDGLSMNPYTIPYYNDPTFCITQFGGIPITSNSAININFFQGYRFGGKIQALDSPRFLLNTSLYNAFLNSTSSTFQNISLWNTYQVTDMRGAFRNVSKFNERIGTWYYSRIYGKYMENIISGTGYNPIQASIFLQDLSSNMTLNNGISLGEIPSYFINSKTNYALSVLKKKNISFNATGMIPITSTFLQSNYSISDAKIAGFSAVDLSNISNTSTVVILNLYNGGFSINDINTIGKYGISDYVNINIPISSLIQSNYTATQLKPYKNKPGYQAFDYYIINYAKSDISGNFSLIELLNVGYSLTQLYKIGYSINQIYPIVSTTAPFSLQVYPNYNILNFTYAGYSLLDISNISQKYPTLSLSNLSNFSNAALKQSKIFASSLKSIGYTISQLLGLLYSLSDLYSANFTIQQIQQTTQIFSDLSYAYAGFTLLDISNAGFPLSKFSTYTPLPTILIQNNITAASLKNIGYTIQQIENLKYGINDLLSANFTISQIIQSNYYQLIDYSNASVSVSSLKSNGFSVLSLKNIYTLSQLQTVYDISSLRVGGYSLNDLNNSQYGYTIINYYIGGFVFEQLVNYGYSFLELYINLEEIYRLQNKISIISALIPLYPPNTLINYGFTASDLYINYNVSLSVLQKANYTTIEISTINDYIKYLSYKNNMSINAFLNSKNIQLVTINSLYDASFNPLQLAATIISTKQDISNLLYTVNSYYTNPYDISSTFDDYFNTIILQNDAIQPFSSIELISSTIPFQYNYTNLLPFGNTTLLGIGSDPIFSKLNTYNNLQYTQFTFLYPNQTIPGSIYILDFPFGFTDVSNGNFKYYNQVNVYANGWLTLCDFSYNQLLALRFFPFPIRTSKSIYSFWQNSAHNILEILFSGTDTNNIQFLITIHIYDYGLITLCNGNGSTILYNPGTLRYVNPDPLLYNLTNNNNNIKYYFGYMTYTYDLSTNTVLSKMYDILRIDLRKSVQDPITGIYSMKGIKNIGYLAGELNGIYSPERLRKGYPLLSLKNIGYSAKQLYDLSYSVMDIVTAFNINIDIYEILNYQ